MNAHTPRRPHRGPQELEAWFLNCIAMSKGLEFHLSRRLALEILSRGAAATSANLAELFSEEEPDEQPERQHDQQSKKRAATGHEKKNRPGGR